MKHYLKTVEETLSEFKTSAEGLTAAEDRLQKGSNETEKISWLNLRKIRCSKSL